MSLFRETGLITFLLLVISNSYSQNDADSLKAFYPLHIGDLWQYEVNETGFRYSASITVVGDTIFENGDRYFVTEFNDDLGTSSQFLERVSELFEVRRYFDQALGSGDKLVYSLTAQKGDTWVSADSMTVSTVSLDSTFEAEIFGESRTMNLYRFEQIDKKTGQFLQESFRTLTHGIGLTLSEGGDGVAELATLTLKGAIINGLQFGDVTSIKFRLPLNPPDQFELFQNYPNPFNPNTFIRYRLFDAGIGSVRMSIYNLRGEEVVRLFEMPQSAGVYTTMWDGRDSRGLPVSSGTYIYQLQVGKKVEQQKMTIVR